MATNLFRKNLGLDEEDKPGRIPQPAASAQVQAQENLFRRNLGIADAVSSGPKGTQGPGLWERAHEAAVRLRRQLGQNPQVDPVQPLSGYQGFRSVLGQSASMAADLVSHPAARQLGLNPLLPAPVGRNYFSDKMAEALVGKLNPQVAEQMRSRNRAMDAIQTDQAKHITQGFIEGGTLGFAQAADKATLPHQKMLHEAGKWTSYLIPGMWVEKAIAAPAVAKLAQAAPKLMKSPIARGIVREGITGTALGGGEALLRTGDVREAGRQAAIGGAFGAGVGGAFAGVGQLGRAGVRAIGRRITREVPASGVLRQVRPEGTVPTRSSRFRVVTPEEQLNRTLEELQPRVQSRLAEAEAARIPPIASKRQLINYVHEGLADPTLSRNQVRRLSYAELIELAEEIGRSRRVPSVADVAREEAAAMGRNLDELIERAGRPTRRLSEIEPSRGRLRMAHAAGIIPKRPGRFIEPADPGSLKSRLRELIERRQTGAVRPVARDLRRETVRKSLTQLWDEQSARKAAQTAGKVPTLEAGPAAAQAASLGEGTVPRMASQAPAPAVATSRTAATGGKPQTRREIVQTFRDALGIPIRIGRYDARRRGGTAVGIYKVRGEAIRTLRANDISTLSHEVGHHIDKKLGLQNPAFDRELLALGRPTSGEGYTRAQIRAEGVAEFVNAYVTDPAKAMQAAPQYYRAFEQRLASEPKLRDALLGAREMYQRWLQQSPRDRILGHLSIGEKEAKSSATTVDQFMTAMVDDLRPLKKAVDDMTGGRELPIDKDPYNLARLSRGWAGKAEAMLFHGVVDSNFQKVGKSLKEVLAPVNGRINDFRAYMTARRALELQSRNIRTGMKTNDAAQVFEEFHGEFGKVFDDLMAFQDANLNQMVESGFMTAEQVANLKANNQHRVPFYRLFEEAHGPQGNLSKRFADLQSPVKSIKGSDRDIIDPLESIVRDVYFFTSLAERNRVGRALVELAEATEGAAKWAERVDIGSTSATENILSVWRNGKKEFWQVQPDLYRAVMALDEPYVDVVTKMLSFPTRALRTGATHNPGFILRNMIRDQFEAFVSSQYGYKPFVDFVSGLMHAVKKDEAYWVWKASGGASTTFRGLERDSLQSSLKELLRPDNAKRIRITWNPLEFLSAVSEKVEEATRLGEQVRGVRVEPPGRQGVMRASLASREVTLDFSRAGTAGRGINRFVAFFNAGVQGMDKVWRNWRYNPGRSTVRALTSVTLPSVILYLINRNDPEYQNLQQWEKDLFWMIRAGDSWLRFPKPPVIGQIFGSAAERVLEWLDKDDPQAMDGFAASLLANAAPNTTMDALGPIMEVTTNKNLLTGRSIVPISEEKEEPRHQYGPYTSETSKAIGGALNVSPRKIDHLVKGYGAGLAGLGLRTSDSILKVLGVVDPPPKPTPRPRDLPVVGEFFSQSSSATVDRFYELRDELEREKATAKREGTRFRHEYQLKQINQTATQLSRLRYELRQILEHPTMSPEAKREAIDRLEAEMNRLAAQATQRAQAAIGN